MSEVLTGTTQSEEEAEPVVIEDLAFEKGTVLFTSKVHNLILTMFPHLRENIGGMERNLNGSGFRLEFRNHTLKVDDRLRKDYTAFVKKHGHRHAIDEDDLQELIETPLDERLRSHPNLNSSNPDGFFEVIAPVPDPSGVLMAILEAALAGDEDTLVRIQDEELEGHNREKVLEACRKALENIYLARAGEAAAQEGPQG